MAMEPRSLPTLSTSEKAAGQEGRCMSFSGKSFVHYIRCSINHFFQFEHLESNSVRWQVSLLSLMRPTDNDVQPRGKCSVSRCLIIVSTVCQNCNTGAVEVSWKQLVKQKREKLNPYRQVHCRRPCFSNLRLLLCNYQLKLLGTIWYLVNVWRSRYVSHFVIFEELMCEFYHRSSYSASDLILPGPYCAVFKNNVE